MENANSWWQDRLYEDGDSILRSHDPLVRALEAASSEDVILLTLALARRQRDQDNIKSA